VELVSGLVVADRFRLDRQLGKGGMGSVWLARHVALAIPCAVKFIHEEAARSADLRARFEREARAAAQLRSPHVVQILDHGVWQGLPYIAMEYLEGEDLGQRLARERTLAPTDILRIASQVARALTKAHAAGLVHRDLKPGNIFLAKDDEGEIAKVLDFGVAKLKEVELDSSTQTGAILGTPFYMSPEQARGSRELDHRSDLWALGVVVYLCLIGRLPFKGKALGDLLMNIIMEPLPVPSAVAAVPPGFDAWWARAAARSPEERFQTAKEMVESLGVALGLSVGEPISGPLSASSSRLAAAAPSAMPISAPTLNAPSGSHALATPGTPIPMGMTPVGPSGPITGSSWSGVGLQQALSVPAPRRRGGLFAALTVVALAAAAGAFFLWRSGTIAAFAPPSAAVTSATSAPANTATATSAPATTSVASAAPSTSPSAPPIDADEAPSASAAPAAAPSQRAVARATAPRRAPPKQEPSEAPSSKPRATNPNCEPNFYLDADGQKHFKPECFK
jgi:serine/threonine-protein kinase